VKILFVGDVIGKPGRRAVRDMLPGLVDEHHVDFTIVNVENAAGGFGITESVLDELTDLPIDCFTSGNHIWDKKEGLELLERRDDLLRPANYPAGNPGRGVFVGETPGGVPVAVLNLEGQVFMKPLASPFEVADRLLEELPGDVRVVVVDFHAEATSEKQALGYYLDGRVSAVLGTHTHVPTADERVLAGGTALVTDVGMTGPYDGIIGFRHDKVLERFLLQTGVPLQVAKGDVRLAAALLDVDEASGKARKVDRMLLRHEI
jgi:hypothetical protein